MTALLIALASALAAPAPAFDHQHAQLDGVLKAYVSGGLVDYAGLKEDRGALDSYLDAAGAVPLATFQHWSKDDQLAFLINIYNATTLQVIIDGYPVDSIKSLGSLFSSVWDKKSALLFGKKVSLNTVEHKIIRKNYAEPRIDFALVCAAMGCPTLRSEAYTGERLDKQLDEQTKAFLATPAKNRVDGKNKQLWLSPIFKWYRKDFLDASGSLTAFVAHYLEPPVDAAFLAAYDVEFTDYDWSLNLQDGKTK